MVKKEYLKAFERDGIREVVKFAREEILKDLCNALKRRESYLRLYFDGSGVIRISSRHNYYEFENLIMLENWIEQNK